MKKFFILIILFLAIFQINLISNTNPEKTNKLFYYQKLLKQLKKQKRIDEDTRLEISLIQKIIEILKAKENYYFFNVKDITNSKEFIDKFLDIISEYSKYLKNIDKLKEENNKLSILDKQLLIIDNSTKNFVIVKLQHDFYSFSLKLLQKKIDYINKNYLSWLKLLMNRLVKIKFEIPFSAYEIKILHKDLKSNLIKMEALKIEKERLQLINNTSSLDIIDKKIKELEKKNKIIVFNLIRYYLFDFFKSIKENQKDFFKYKNLIENISQEYNLDRYFINSLNHTLDKIIELKYGPQELILHDTKKTFTKTISYIFYLLKKPLFKVNNKGISLLDILFALLIFFLGFYAGSIYKKYIVKLTYRGIALTQSTQTILSNIGYYLIITISFFITLKVIGINLSSLTVIIGALSVGIGFGLQSVISNFICGLILLFEKSIKVGDVIELDQNLIGKVKNINMRATVVNTFDNIEIIIPNQTLFQNNVINWTLSDDIRRLKIPFGVAYGTDIDKMESVIISELYESNLHFIRKNESRKPQIIFTKMDSSSINFELLIWVELSKIKTPQALASDFLKLIYKALYKHNIEIPFPQIDVHVKEIEDELKVKFTKKD